MTRLQWLDCWDRLRTQVSTGAQTSFGRNQLLDLMNTIEREMVRKAEQNISQEEISNVVSRRGI